MRKKIYGKCNLSLGKALSAFSFASLEMVSSSRLRSVAATLRVSKISAGCVLLSEASLRVALGISGASVSKTKSVS